MKTIKLVVSSAFGIEKLVKKEIEDMGFNNIKIYHGQIEFDAKYCDIPYVNIWTRCGDRVYLKMGQFEAKTFDELFNNIKNIPWENLLSRDSKFPISWVSSVDSILFSKSDCQKIAKKAIVERLRNKYSCSDLPETGNKYAIKLQIRNNICVISVDTSGIPLHRRGYREDMGEAAIKETLAAALVKLSRWNIKTPLLDPMCGSGTILIEAAMIARNIAPGANRRFISEGWDIIPSVKWIGERDKAYSLESNIKLKIFGSDIDGKIIETAKENAKLAGVEQCIEFKVKNYKKLKAFEEIGTIITNPPYGERLLKKSEVEKFYNKLGRVFRNDFPKWEYNVISSYNSFEKDFGLKSNFKKKLFNGGIKCHYYQYNKNKKNYKYKT